MGWLHGRRMAVPAARSLLLGNGHFCKRPLCTKAADDIRGSLVHELRKHAPVFPVDAENIQVLRTPTEFFAALNEGLTASKQRVVLASLYVGTGEMEQALISRLAAHMAAHRSLRATVLVDGMRGTRRDSQGDGRPSSSLALLAGHMVGRAGLATRVDPLPQRASCGHNQGVPEASPCKAGAVREGDVPLDACGSIATGAKEGRLRLCFYRTPTIPAVADLLFSQRFKEIFGVCHLKVYVFDDTLLLSGANLSESYFTTRQDRYVLLRHVPALADFFERLVNTVGDFSYRVLPDATLSNTTDANVSPAHHGAAFIRQMSAAVNRLLSETTKSQEAVLASAPRAQDSSHDAPGYGSSSSTLGGAAWPSSRAPDTWVMPSVQMATLQIRQDEACVLAALESIPPGSRLDVASAYFNVTPRFEEALLRCGQGARLHILTAAPQANGFYGAKGVAGLVPGMYSALEHQFYQKVRGTSGRGGASHAVLAHLFEYEREGWTFHAKGIWCTLPGNDLPSVTFVGSPNFGYRSLERDLEAQIAVLTGNEALQAQLGEEMRLLYEHSSPVSDGTFNHVDRKPTMKTRLLAATVSGWL